MRHSNRTRRGRALFVFTIGIVLIVLASAFFLLRAAGNDRSSSASAPRRRCWAARCWWSPRVAAAQRRGLVRRPARAADHPAAARRTRPAPSRRRHRRAPARSAGVPRRRTDVADLRRAVPGGHSACARKRPVGTRPTRDLDDEDDGSELESPPVPPEEQALRDRRVDLRRPRGRADRR